MSTVFLYFQFKGGELLIRFLISPQDKVAAGQDEGDSEEDENDAGIVSMLSIRWQ